MDFGWGLVYVSALGLLGLSAFIIASTLFKDEEQYKTSEKFDPSEDKKNVEKKDYGIILRYSKPFFKRYISPVVANLKNKQKIRKRYKKVLANSGLTEELTADDFFSFKIFLIIGFPVVFVFVRSFGEFYDWPMSIVPLVALFGFFYPDIWARGRIEKRRKEIIDSMPFMVDMLALSVEAGLDFMAALSKVSEKAPKSGLVDELNTVMKEVRVGSSRSEALRGMAWRTGVLEMSSFCATLIAADSVGASIGPILKVLSQDIRQKRSAMIEKKGAQAATKILLPMMFFILPAVAIVIGTPFVLQLLSGFKK